jgi:hypothetical protein
MKRQIIKQRNFDNAERNSEIAEIQEMIDECEKLKIEELL